MHAVDEMLGVADEGERRLNTGEVTYLYPPSRTVAGILTVDLVVADHVVANHVTPLIPSELAFVHSRVGSVDRARVAYTENGAWMKHDPILVRFS